MGTSMRVPPGAGDGDALGATLRLSPAGRPVSMSFLRKSEVDGALRKHIRTVSWSPTRGLWSWT
ncbi:hypothetical protein BG452_02305 [Streptomyces sp. CBMA123]|nr:hypothetical protein [Streptomyces sp. CBMA123]